MFSPALMARRASESWINTPPIEVKTPPSDPHMLTLPNTCRLSPSDALALVFQTMPAPTTLQRKKSLPDFQGLPKATDPMSREEVSVLSSARREEVRRQAEEAERLRANPLLYLVSPHVKVSYVTLRYFTVTQLLNLPYLRGVPAHMARHVEVRVHLCPFPQ